MASEDLMPENATNPVGWTDYRTVPAEADDKIIRAMCVAIENTDTDVEEANLRDGYDCWKPVALAAWSAALSASPAPAGDLVERDIAVIRDMVSDYAGNEQWDAWSRIQNEMARLRALIAAMQPGSGND